MSDVLLGAEPMSRAGNDVGVLFVHGYTGSPSSLRDMAEAAASCGYTVELPRIAGHGTSVDDLMATGWSDWTSDVESAYIELRARVGQVVVVALSAGGAWSSWLALRHPEIAGIVYVNPFVTPLGDDLMAQLHEALESGIDIAPGEGPDIAKQGVVEVAYDGTPLRPLLGIQQALVELAPRLSEIAMPMLIATSPQDHVIDPANSDHLATVAAGPVRRVSLDNSFHVATQDHDQPLLIDNMLSFIKEVTS